MQNLSAFLSRNPYSTEKLPPGSRGTPGSPGTPVYGRPNPDDPGTGGERLPPGSRTPPPPGAPPPPPSDTPAPVFQTGTDPGFASPLGGPAGVGGSGGFGFTNLQQYMYANPLTQPGNASGTGYSPTPSGYSSGSYDAGIHGFAPNGGYTAGMAGVDNSLNQVYGRGAPNGYQDPNAAQPQGYAATPPDQWYGLGPPPSEGNYYDFRNWLDAYEAAKNKAQNPNKVYDNPNRHRGV